LALHLNARREILDRSGETFGLVILRAAAGRGAQRLMDRRRPEGRRHRDADPSI